MTPEDARELFPALERYVWLTHAGGSPFSTRMREAVEAAIARPYEGDTPFGWAEEYYGDRQALLDALGRMFRTHADNVTLTRGTAQGLSFLRGLDWRPGDNVVTAKGEFPTNLYPWLSLEPRGVEVRMVEPDDGRVTPEGVFALMDERTRAVSLSLVQFWNGYRIDSAAIGAACRSSGVAFALDAAQAAGAVRIDVDELRCDLVASGSIKWMQGPTGIGFCYVHPDLAARIDPPSVGLGSMASHDYFEPVVEFAPGARRFQESACSFLDVAALRACVELLEEIGFDLIEERVLDLCEYAAKGLESRGCAIVEPWPRSREESSGIISFRPAGETPQEIQARLAEKNILVHERGEYVRISPHYYTTTEEIDLMLDSL
jgi:cysteine desulfurase / selenocysteine lyase